MLVHCHPATNSPDDRESEEQCVERGRRSLQIHGNGVEGGPGCGVQMVQKWDHDPEKLDDGHQSGPRPRVLFGDHEEGVREKGRAYPTHSRGFRAWSLVEEHFAKTQWCA